MDLFLGKVGNIWFFWEVKIKGNWFIFLFINLIELVQIKIVDKVFKIFYFCCIKLKLIDGYIMYS